MDDATEHTQSLDSFSRTAVETLDRIGRTGSAEVLTVDGRPRAVLLSPAAYEALARGAELSRDVAMIRQSMREFRDGRGIDARKAFDELRAELLARQAAEEARPTPVGAGR